MNDPEHARLMLNLARKDFKALQGMVDDSDSFDDSIFGFHAQQAIEKAFKGWLSFLGVAYPKTHNLEQLWMLLKDNAQYIPDQFDSLVDMTDFAVQFRYEAFEDLTAAIDRHQIVRQVSELLNYFENLLKAADQEA